MLSRVRLLMLVSLVLVLGLMAGCVAPVADAPADDAAADAGSEEMAEETPEELTRSRFPPELDPVRRTCSFLRRRGQGLLR